MFIRAGFNNARGQSWPGGCELDEAKSRVIVVARIENECEAGGVYLSDSGFEQVPPLS
jgi:hypothetical protein